MKTLLCGIALTLLGVAWIWRIGWYEETSSKLLALEREQKELQNEWGNLQAELNGLARYARVESQARQRLGMISPTAPPDTIWTETPVEKPNLGSIAFLSPLQFRERQSSRPK